MLSRKDVFETLKMSLPLWVGAIHTDGYLQGHIVQKVCGSSKIPIVIVVIMFSYQANRFKFSRNATQTF